MVGGTIDLGGLEGQTGRDAKPASSRRLRKTGPQPKKSPSKILNFLKKGSQDKDSDTILNTMARLGVEVEGMEKQPKSLEPYNLSIPDILPTTPEQEYKNIKKILESARLSLATLETEHQEILGKTQIGNEASTIRKSEIERKIQTQKESIAMGEKRLQELSAEMGLFQMPDRTSVSPVSIPGNPSGVAPASAKVEKKRLLALIKKERQRIKEKVQTFRATTDASQAKKLKGELEREIQWLYEGEKRVAEISGKPYVEKPIIIEFPTGIKHKTEEQPWTDEDEKKLLAIKKELQELYKN